MISGLQEHITIFLYMLFAWIYILRFCFYWVKFPKRIKYIAILFSLASFIPLGNLSIAQYILSFHPVFSFASCALGFIIIYNEFFDKWVLSTIQYNIFLYWNLTIGSLLYLSSFGILPVDIYYYGSIFSWWFILTFVCNIVFIILHYHTLFCIFLGYIISFSICSSYSYNYFDYIIDPFIVILSIGILLGRQFSSWQKKTKS